MPEIAVHDDLTVTKIGLIATTRPGDSRSEFVSAPSEVVDAVRRDIDKY